jgi:flagellin
LFTNGGGDKYMSGTDPVLQIDLAGITNGKDMAQKVFNTINGSPNFRDHYTQYAYDPANPTRIFMYDNRTAYNENEGNPGGGSTFEMQPRDVSGVIMESAKEREKLWIQTGSRQGDGFFIEKPITTVMELGLTGLDVSSYENATRSIEVSQSADKILSEKRNQIGAYTNRLEHSYEIATQTSENTTAAESRIRDADIAKEMVEFMKRNVLSQSGNSILAQANAQRENVLQLLS